MASYTLSIAAIFRNEAAYLEEWLAFHEVVGVEHFYLYDNGSTDQGSSLLHGRPGVTVIDWPGERQQLPAYRDALHRAREQARWLAFLDLDEFLFNPEYVPVPSVLRAYEHVPAVGVCWAVFGTSEIQTPQESVLGSYAMRARTEHPAHRHVKSIVQPAQMPVHLPRDPHHFYCAGVDTEGRPLDGPFAQTVTWQWLRINHYWSKSIAEARRKERTPRADNGELRQGLTSAEYNELRDESIMPYRPLVEARRRR